MNKAQALHMFWSSFNIPAYDESTVPDDAVMPYITYSVLTDSLGQALPLSATIWYQTNSWEQIQLKAEEIARRIGENGYVIMKLDNGYIWMTKGTPFAQRVPSEDRDVRQMYINVTAEFLTEY